MNNNNETLVNTTINNIINTINEGNSFLIASHISPDLDCICSSLALGYGLKKLSKKVRYFSRGPLDRTDLLQYSNSFSDQFDLKSDEILILVDCHSLNRISDEILKINTKNQNPIIAIDHHEPEENKENTKYLILEDYPSTTIIIKKLLDAMNIAIDKDIATLILKGFFYDTDYFKYIKDGSYFVFKDVYELLASNNLSLKDLYAEMYYNSTVSSRKYIGRMIDNMELHSNDKIAFIFSSVEDIEFFGKENIDDSALYDAIFRVKSIQVIIHIKEKEDTSNGGSGILLGCSLRSKKGVNIQNVARKFGGGGHINASGFRVQNQPLSILKESVIEYTLEAIKIASK